MAILCPQDFIILIKLAIFPAFYHFLTISQMSISRTIWLSFRLIVASFGAIREHIRDMVVGGPRGSRQAFSIPFLPIGGLFGTF
jgi:hypothetical protein